MANCTNYGCDDALGDYVENACQEILLGGVDAVIFLECNHAITDPSNASQINAAIANGTATLVTGIKVSLDAPSPIEIETNRACSPTRVVNYNRSGTYKNDNVSAANVTFHQGIFSGRQFGGLILHECGTSSATTPQITWIDRAISFTGGRIIPGNYNEQQRFEGAFKYLGLLDDDIYPVPAGIF